jgi:hypothetical protein
MVKDDQGPSLPSLLKSGLATISLVCAGSLPVCIGRDTDRLYCRTYYPSDQQGENPYDHFHVRYIYGSQATRTGMLWSRTEGATNKTDHGFRGRQAEARGLSNLEVLLLSRLKG